MSYENDLHTATYNIHPHYRPFGSSGYNFIFAVVRGDGKYRRRYANAHS